MTHSSWKSVVLDDVLDRIEAGKSFSGPAGPARSDEWGIIKVSAMTYGTFREDENKAIAAGSEFSTAHEIRPGDLLVSRANTRDYVGASVLVQYCRPRLLLSDKSLRLITNSRVNRRWLWHALSSPASRAYFSNTSTGVKSGMRNISQATLRNLPLRLPPLPQQRRIVDILEDHLSRLDAADHLIATNRARGASLLEHLVRYRVIGSHVVGIRSSRLLPASESTDGELELLPVGWSWQRLGDLADVVGGITKDSKNQGDASWPEVPYLRVANVQRGRLVLDTVSTIRAPKAKVEALRLERGDVLLNEGGDRDKLARGWIWEDQLDTCIHQNHVFRARIRNEAIKPKLLSWAANTVGGPWAERNGKQTTNLASISLRRIRLMPIPVPPQELQSSLEQQITADLDRVARLDEQLAQAQRRSQMLRRALLSAAFSGQLTGRVSDMDRVEELADV